MQTSATVVCAHTLSSVRWSEINHMKPFTTIESLADGSLYLPAQLEGLDSFDSLDLLRGAEVTRCCIPAAQRSDLAWSVCLEFSSGYSLEITSSSTLVRGWDEYGTINLALAASAVNDVDQVGPSELVGFVVGQIRILRWQSNGILVDAGIEFRSKHGGEVFSAVAVDIPGAFSMSLPGDAPKNWQFPADEYARVDIQMRRL